jgi:DNA invertase Pin-like site-specific DNA recombinase
MFQMMGVFAEFERAMIQERVRAGLKRAVDEGKQLGRPPIAPELQARIRDALRARESMRKIAARLGVSTNTVLKVSRVPFEGASAAAGA